MSEREKDDNARSAGKKAFYDGVPLIACPLRARSSRHAWREGWMAEDREHRERSAQERRLLGRQPEQHVLNCSSCGRFVPEPDRVSYHRNGQLVKVQHRLCADDEARAEFQKSGNLTTRLITTATLSTMKKFHEWGVDDAIREAADRLAEDVKRFDIEAWFDGVQSLVEPTVYDKRLALVYPRTTRSLQAIVENAPHSITAKLVMPASSDITVTGGEMAGRSLVEMETTSARLTLITASREQTSRMGIQGIDGTEAECRIMIHAVRTRWRELTFRKANS